MTTAILFGFLVTLISPEGGTIQILTASQSPAICETLRQQSNWEPSTGGKALKSEQCTMFLISPLVPEKAPAPEPSKPEDKS